MMLLPYLALDDGYQCVELASNCRTLAYIARTEEPRPAWPWTPVKRGDCPECCCPECDDGDYTFPHDWSNNPAPWADPANPKSWEFFGLLLDSGGIVLEPAWSSRRRGDSVFSRAEYRPRTLTITGTIVASTARGTVYGEEWLIRTLTEARTFTAKVMKHCPDPTAPEFANWTPPPTQESYLEPVLWDDGQPAQWVSPFGQVWWEPLTRTVLAGAGRCDDPADAIPLAPLADNHVPTLLPDTGWRELPRVRFLSMEDLDDEPMPTCEGKRVAIICEVLGEGTWFPTVDPFTYSVLLDRPFDGCQARPIDWLADIGVPQSSTSPLLPEAPVTVTSGYRRPLLTSSIAALTPVLPWSVQAAVVAEISGGEEGTANVAMRIYEALDGVPAPDTVLGCSVYGRREPCAEALIGWVPPGATIVIDGRHGRIITRTPGYADEPAEGVVTAGDGSPFTHPRLGCGQRYWVVLSADAYRMSIDGRVKLTYVPVEVS